MISLLLFAALTFPVASASAQEEADLTYDVVVYGGTSGGVMSAYAAKKAGQSVLLVEPGRCLGGMTSGGLGYTDVGDERTVTGLAREFYRRVGQVYGKASRDSIAAVLEAQGRAGWKYYRGAPGEAWNSGDGAGEGWTFEPHVAERVFESFVDEAGIETFFSRRVTEVEMDGDRIERITLAYAGTRRDRSARGPDLTVTADVFIDATYEGDLMARAGVSFTVGRESNDRFGEDFNGVQRSKTKWRPEAGAWVESEYPDGVDPYVEKANPESGLLPEIQHEGLAPIGTGDALVQAYNFRMTLCRCNRMQPLKEPAGYDADRYALLLRMMEASPWEKGLRTGFTISPMPNGATDWNNKGGYGFSTDYIGGSYDYPAASYAERDSIWRAHMRYQQGLLWFVGHDERVPKRLREEMQQWGTCRGEFLATEGWPPQLYVREARRMRGAYTATEDDVFRRTVVEDGVAFASYPGDSHNVQRVAVENEDGQLVPENDGNIAVGPFPITPYPVSYRAITPRPEEATNLLVTFALSASHVAYGSVRMEPVFMVLGQSAGLAAARAAERGIPVQEIDVRALQEALRPDPLAGRALPEGYAEDYRFDPNLGDASGE